MRNQMMVLIVCLWALTTYGQEKSISFSTAELELGMSKDAVMEALNNIDVSMNIDGENIFLSSTAHGSQEPEFIGNLYFKNGMLAFVSKNWGDYRSPESFNAFDALASLIANENDHGKYTAVVKYVNSDRSPEGKTDEIQLDFGEKKIKLCLCTHQKSGSWIQIREVLEK